jgi:hypothetical protein
MQTRVSVQGDQPRSKRPYEGSGVRWTTSGRYSSRNTRATNSWRDAVRAFQSAAATGAPVSSAPSTGAATCSLLIGTILLHEPAECEPLDHAKYTNFRTDPRDRPASARADVGRSFARRRQRDAASTDGDDSVERLLPVGSGAWRRRWFLGVSKLRVAALNCSATGIRFRSHSIRVHLRASSSPGRRPVCAATCSHAAKDGASPRAASMICLSFSPICWAA